MHPFQSLLHFCQVKIKNHLNGFLRGSSCRVLNMRLQGQRLMDYVNTKWEEMIHDWRAVILKEQQCSYQHSVENEWMVTQHRHRGMLFASVNGFISQFTLDKVQEHMALFNLTARSSLPVLLEVYGITLCPHHQGKIVGGYEPHR